MKMGTSIKIEVFKGEKTTKKQWDKFKDRFFQVYEDAEDEGILLLAPVVYCSYSMADLSEQMKMFEEFKGIGVEFQLTYLENDPDQSEVL